MSRSESVASARPQNTTSGRTRRRGPGLRRTLFALTAVLALAAAACVEQPPPPPPPDPPDDSPVTITAATLTIAYGEDIPEIVATYEGLGAGQTTTSTPATCSTEATAGSPVGTYATTCTGAEHGDSEITYVDGTLTIEPAQAIVTASNASLLYGGDAPAITPTYTGLVNGDTEPETPATCSTTVTSTSEPGTYASTCSGADDPNYVFTYVDGTVTVDPAPVVVTASSAFVHFGEEPGPVTASYSGLVNGDTEPAVPATCSTTATAESPAGEYPSTCSGAVDPHYTFTYVDGVITVTTAEVPVTVTASSATITYGDELPEVSASYSGFGEGQTEPATPATCSTDATANSPAGTYAVTCSGASDPNYEFVYVDGTITILPKAATITASNGTKVYGDAPPEITPIYSGLVDGDEAPATPPTCTTTATSSVSVGTYPSSCSGAADPSYTFTYTNGSVTVTKAPLTVTAESRVLTYGFSPSTPTIARIYTGLVNGDTAPTPTQPTCSTPARGSGNTNSNVGVYPSTCSGGNATNYTFTFVAGTVTIVPAPVVITASSPTVTYGSTPTITPIYSGLTNNKTAATTPPTCTSTATSSSPVGTYESSCEGAADQNFTFTYATGTVTVTPKAVTVTPEEATRTEGDAVPDIAPTYSGLVNDDTPATEATCSTTATSESGPGNYTSSCSGADDPNYTFSYTDRTFRVHPTEPWPLTITAPTGEHEVGAPAIPTYSGLIPGDTAPLVPPTCSWGTTVGEHPSICEGAEDPDYDITYVNGDSVAVIPDGYAEYKPQAHATTLTASANLANATSLSVASGTGAGFGTYTNLSIVPGADASSGQAYFCKNIAATGMSTCSSNGATGTAPAGSYVTDAPMSKFDVYTVAGGRANVSPSSLTILSDVPEEHRGVPSGVAATANNGIITFVQSTEPTGTFDLTYGICAAGTPTYDEEDPTCQTGVIHYSPGVTSDIGQTITVLIATNHTYQKIDTAVTAPATVDPGETFKVHVAPAPSAIPKLQSSSAGDASVTSSSKFTTVYPIPAGFTVESYRLIGGDAITSAPTNGAFATLCTTYKSGNCVADAPSGNYVYNTSPYIVVQMPSSVTVPGGRQLVMPTLEVTLKATGPSGTVGEFYLSEVINTTVANLLINTTANFFGYPTNPANPGVSPPLAPPKILASTTIN
jgi:hypothetical protein